MLRKLLSAILFLGVIPCEAALFTFYNNSELGSKLTFMLNIVTCIIAGIYFLINMTKKTYNERIVVKYIVCGIAIIILNQLSSMIANEEDNSRTISIICLFAYYLYVLYMFKEPDDVIKSINITLFFLIMASFIFYYIKPMNVTYIENATTRYFKGVAYNRNSYADISLFYIASNIYLWSKKKKYTLFYLPTTIIALYTTYLTHSATSTVCAFLLVLLSLIYLFTKRTIPLSIFVGGYIFIFVSLIIIQSSNTPFLSQITRYFQKSNGLTGRTNIWTTTMKLLTEAPVFGRGFDTYVLARNGIVENDPHNSILYTLLTQGVCGIFIIIYMLYKPIKIARQTLGNNDLFAFLYIFIMIWMVRGLTESVMSYTHFTFWISVVAVEMLITTNQKNILDKKDLKNEQTI